MVHENDKKRAGHAGLFMIRMLKHIFAIQRLLDELIILLADARSLRR